MKDTMQDASRNSVICDEIMAFLTNAGGRRGRNPIRDHMRRAMPGITSREISNALVALASRNLIAKEGQGNGHSSYWVVGLTPERIVTEGKVGRCRVSIYGERAKGKALLAEMRAAHGTLPREHSDAALRAIAEARL